MSLGPCIIPIITLLKSSDCCFWTCSIFNHAHEMMILIFIFFQGWLNHLTSHCSIHIPLLFHHYHYTVNSLIIWVFIAGYIPITCHFANISIIIKLLLLVLCPLINIPLVSPLIIIPLHPYDCCLYSHIPKLIKLDDNMSIILLDYFSLLLLVI